MRDLLRDRPPRRSPPSRTSGGASASRTASTACRGSTTSATPRPRVRFLSVEPLLEDLGTIDLTASHWVIVGGESGHGARPMQPEWVRSIRDQCRDAGVPFFFKQWGGVRKSADRPRARRPDLRRHAARRVPTRSPRLAAARSASSDFESQTGPAFVTQGGPSLDPFVAEVRRTRPGPRTSSTGSGSTWSPTARSCRSGRIRYAYIDGFAGTGYHELKHDESDGGRASSPNWTSPRSRRSSTARRGSPSRSSRGSTSTSSSRRAAGRRPSSRSCEASSRTRPTDIIIENAEANAYLQELCSKCSWTSSRAVLFIDPFGMQLSWETVEADRADQGHRHLDPLPGQRGEPAA